MPTMYGKKGSKKMGNTEAKAGGQTSWQSHIKGTGSPAQLSKPGLAKTAHAKSPMGSN